MATTPGWGLPVDSPVRTIPCVMSRSALGLQAALRQTASRAARDGRRGIRFPLALDDLADGLQGGDRIRPRPRGLGRLRGDGIADVQENLQQQLFPLVGRIQIRHAKLVAGATRPFVGLAVNRVQIRENALSRSWHAGNLRHPSGFSTSPLGTFGMKYVDFCGITSPASATANTCSTFGGFSSTAHVAEPVRTAASASRASGV